MFKAYGWLLPPVGGFDGGKGSVDAAVIGDPDEVLEGNCHCPPEVEGTFRASPEAVPVSCARPVTPPLTSLPCPEMAASPFGISGSTVSAIGGAHGRTTRTVQCAPSSTSRLTEPNTAFGSGQAPGPTTTSEASLDCSTSASTGEWSA